LNILYGHFSFVIIYWEREIY